MALNRKAKKSAKKAKTAKKVSVTKKKTGKSSSIVSRAVASPKIKQAASSLFGSGPSRRGGGGRAPKNARSMLKRAYERKAKRLIRIGMLGQARRVLRKKATVI